MKTSFFLIIVSIVTGSCGSQTPADSGQSIADLPTNTTDKSSCIVSYQTKLDQLLPLGQIQKHYSGDMSKAKKNYNYRPEAKKHNMDTYEYLWPSDRKRKMKLMGREMEYDVSNRIGLTWVGNDMFMMAKKGSAIDNFKFYYRNMSASEKEAAFQKAGEQMAKKGYDQKQTETAINMGKELANDDVMFRPVDGIGDAATWRIKEKSLIVLTGQTTFQVLADISENDDENITLAKKLAAEVLAKCK